MKLKNLFPIVLKITCVILPWLALAVGIANRKNAPVYSMATGVFAGGTLLQTISLAYLFIKDIVTMLNREKTIEHEVLKFAYQKEGIITENELSLIANVPLTEAKEYLEDFVKKGSAEMRITKSGGIVYLFKEFVSKKESLTL